jgi:eukaryotic-like serine/threonine-protein kinase
MDTTDELPVTAAGHGGAPALVLGRYRLGERLGAGGFGTVYAATDERLRRAVAVKVIPADRVARDRPRAQREALAAGRLDHPAVVRVFDAGEDSRARYLVSELVHGRTLDELAAEGALSDRDVLRIGLALAGALQHAHDRGVVHRDVKPQNVIVPEAPRSADGVAKLADFGVAHLAGDEPLTRTGDVVGTLAYMAPEQAAGHRVDERADLYSLALVVYEALAGTNPVRAGSPAATARRVGTVLPSLRRTRRDLPEELCAAVDRALRPRPEERGTLDELAEALADALPEVSDEGGTVAPHPLERAEALALPGWAARAAAGVLAGGLVAAALAATGAQAAAGAFAGVAVAAFPRAAWLAAALATIGFLGAENPGGALLVAAAAAPVPLLLRGAGALWSVPALAPLVGIVSLAGAFPALAGTARGWMRRAALGALGAWWALLAQPLLGRALLQGPGAVGVPASGGQVREAGQRLAAGVGPHGLELGPLAHAPAGDVVHRVFEPLVTGGALLYPAIWAVAAAVLPWLVRGRHLAVDVIAAAAWAATLGAATAATAPPEPRGLVAGAVAAGALAVAAMRVRAVEP